MRLHHLHRIDHAGFHARARHLQGFLGHLQILARHFDLSGGGFQIEVGLADFGFDLPARVLQLGLALRQHRFRLRDVARRFPPCQSGMLTVPTTVNAPCDWAGLVPITS